LAVGVIVKITVIGAVVMLVSVPLILAPLPLEAIPVTVPVLFLVHVNVVPIVVLVNAMVAIVADEHIVWLEAVAIALAVGFTNTVAVDGVPKQPLAVGVIVKVTVIGAAVELVSVPLMSPLPLAAIPVTVGVLFLTHVNVVPVVVLVNAIVAIAVAEHIVWLEGVAIALAVGFTKTVAVIVLPVQPLNVGVMLKVTVIGAAVVLVRIPVILAPLPPAPIPVTVPVLSLVHAYVVPVVVLLNAIAAIALPEHFV
jgi:hypothetical protein